MKLKFLEPILKFVGTLRGKLIVLVSFVLLLAGAYFVGYNHGYNKGLEKRDEAVVQCDNDKVVKTLDELKAELERIEREKLFLESEFVNIRDEAEKRQRTINELKRILSNTQIPDDKISPRTKEFYRQLNERAKEIRTLIPDGEIVNE